MTRIRTTTNRDAALAAAAGLALTMVSSIEAKGPPLPEPNPERGSIAVEISVGRSHAVQAFFVRVEDEADLFEGEYVLPSSYSKKKQIFLLNAKPGRYVVVAARAAKQRGLSGTYEYDAYFDMDMIRQTEVHVVPNRLVFLGEIFARYADEKQMKDADEAQAHYFRLIDPKGATRGAFARSYLGHKVAHRVVLERIVKDPACERAFWQAARDQAFKDDLAWLGLIVDRLGGLSQSGP